MTSPLATAALHQFKLRVAAAREKYRAGTWPALEADARLYPWLALALRCGVDPAQLHPELVCTLEDYRRCGNSEVSARHLMALHFCSDADCQAEVARARDAAIRSHHQDAPDLTALAIRIGCPAHVPQTQEAA